MTTQYNYLSRQIIATVDTSPDGKARTESMLDRFAREAAADRAAAKSKTIGDCWCVYCGHPVMAEGVAIDGEDDTDRAGHGRDRCADTACQSSAVATYQGGVLVVADR